MTAADQRDYYEVLGVPRDADAKGIKAAFRRLAMRYHPDRNKAPDAEAHFKEIAKAYAVLSDPKKRSQYDAHGASAVAGFSHEDLYGGINFEDLFGDLGFDFSGFKGTQFNDFFGTHRSNRTPHGPNQEIELRVPLERVASGGEEVLRYTRDVRCSACQGSGARPGTAPRQCPTCQGTGEKVQDRNDGGISFRHITTCPECSGRGMLIDQPCTDCNGAGRQEREAALKLQIPAGMDEGTVLRVPGHGAEGKAPDSAAGDLYVVVRSQADPRFERRGTELLRTETVEIADAVLGTSLEVPTLAGRARVEVPPGTQPDTLLRLPGKGLPEASGHRHGDLVVQIRVRIPESLSVEELRLYRRLRELGPAKPPHARRGQST